jgi:hypothetical protein
MLTLARRIVRPRCVRASSSDPVAASPASSVSDRFQVLQRRSIPELGNVDCVVYRHSKTGAAVLSLRAVDDNKVFGVSFRTPPSDSTGVAHILEHSVLCGSRKYPVKEPFIELLKSSLQVGRVCCFGEGQAPRATAAVMTRRPCRPFIAYAA